ncbi:MAG: hypothetical protein WBY94_18125 [Polyangiaceae bacterium]
MPSAILDGLSQVDVTGHVILATTVACLLLAMALNLFVHARYGVLERELKKNGLSEKVSVHPALGRIAREVREAARRSPEPNIQAIVEETLQIELKPLLLAERFVRAATGLVIILGLLGTFYGLTLSIGRLVELVSTDPGGVTDLTQAITGGLTRALSGMAVAFSNSLFGIASAVVLTIFGVFANVTDRRTAFMVQVESYADRLLAETASHRFGTSAGTSGNLERTVAVFDQSVERLQSAVAQFDGALQAFTVSTRDFREFNLHLKDNVQRMSLSFGDFSERLKSELVALKSNGGHS